MEEVVGMNGEINDISAVEVESEEVRWLLREPMIPLRGITIIAGNRGTSKTTLACWLAAQVTAQGQNVFLASQEDDIPEFIQPRIEAAEANKDRLWYPDEQDRLLTFPADVPRLARYVNQRDISLVLLDPLEAFVPGAMSADQVRAALTPLGNLSRQHDCAIVFVHHLRKSGGKTVFEAMGGSGALSNIARALYLYGGEPEQDKVSKLRGEDEPDVELEDDGVEKATVLANFKLSAGGTPPSLAFKFHLGQSHNVESVPRVSLEGESRWSAQAVFETAISGAKDEESELMIEQAITFLLHFLAEGAQTTRSLNAAAKEAGVMLRTLERARAKVKAKPFQDGGQWWVKLPDLPDTLPEEWS
jgi:hypothetical protein